MILLVQRILLAVLGAPSNCCRAQPVTTYHSASEHVHAQVTAAELFYLRHVRSCAASASGKRSTCSGEISSLCTSGLLVVLDCAMSLVKVVLQDMLQALDFVMSMCTVMLQSMPSNLEMSMIMAVLQSTPSPLEICACIAVVDGSEAKNTQQIINAVTILLLASCDWHVPRVLSYHNLICRFLSACCMQALFPYSTTLSCLAILKPTFGKRPHNTLTPTPESQVGASEHASTSADDTISLDEVITKLKATADEDIRAREILAAATTLRDSTGRARKDALRKMASAWGVTVNEKVADKYKPRPNAALEQDIRASVCQAALDWESGMERDAEPLRKKNKNHRCCRALCFSGSTPQRHYRPAARNAS